MPESKAAPDLLCRRHENLSSSMKPQKNPKLKPVPITRILLITIISIVSITLLYIISSSNGFSAIFSSSFIVPKDVVTHDQTDTEEKYLYWGYGIDCPGINCRNCAGLFHQESGLRCALEEAMLLQRTFVMPSTMCLNPIHNEKLQHMSNASVVERWAARSCAMDSMYDLELISETIPVILDNSKRWYHVLSTSIDVKSRGVAHVEGARLADLKENEKYSDTLLINRTASPRAWYMECTARNNRGAVILPYSFLPSMASKKLRDAAKKIVVLLGDFDAMHVRRGDVLKTKKDKFGVARSLHPHLDRDTRPEFILCRIAKWVPQGRMLFIASNEKKVGFFSPLAARYKLAYSSNFSSILDPVLENNYQLFMIERLILMRAKTFIKTYSDNATDFTLTDDPKKRGSNWQIPVYTKDNEEC